MAAWFDTISDEHRRFIAAQHLFFVATAAADGRVNLSPKGLDSLRVLSPTRVLWLNLTGSGNETAAHLLDNDRMTIMFCSFERQPLIMRLYGRARAVHEGEPDWGALYGEFEPLAGARQMFDMTVESVQTSCGFAVPRFTFEDDRDTLSRYHEKLGEDGVRRYWADNNTASIDGRPTGMPVR